MLRLFSVYAGEYWDLIDKTEGIPARLRALLGSDKLLDDNSISSNNCELKVKINILV